MQDDLLSTAVRNARQHIGTREMRDVVELLKRTRDSYTVGNLTRESFEKQQGAYLQCDVLVRILTAEDAPAIQADDPFASHLSPRIT